MNLTLEERLKLYKKIRKSLRNEGFETGAISWKYSGFCEWLFNHGSVLNQRVLIQDLPELYFFKPENSFSIGQYWFPSGERARRMKLIDIAIKIVKFKLLYQ